MKLRNIRLVLLFILLAVLGWKIPRAAAGVLQQSQTVIEGQPLRILVNPDNSLQVYHQKYTQGATYGYAGSGFFVAAGDIVYGPFFTPFETLSHEGPTGDGSRSSPFKVVTRQRAGDSGLEIVQTISYVNGEQFFQLDWQVSNNGGQRACYKAYHAADLYFADDDYGIGYYNSRTGSVGGFNQSRDWFMVFTPSYAPTHYEEAFYSTIWERVYYAADLQDTIVPDYTDNGAALQWDGCLQPGETAAVGDLWSFGVSEAEVIRPGGGGGAAGPAAPTYRPPGLFTPQITTHIPTPLDISTDPKVIFSNLLLAALAMIVFTIASESLNRTTAENEEFIQRLFRPMKWIGDGLKRASPGDRLKHPFWYELIKLAIVAGIYGFVFSLLDSSWNPLSLTGLTLFVTMTVAYGLVGLSDDIVQWLTARRWKISALINVRIGNFLLIVASTAFSRYFGIIPGIMFGTPEAFDIQSSSLDRKRENRLLAIAAVILILVLLISWIPTAFTALARSWNPPDFILVPLSGLESFLLLIFAITVQNLFLQMLDFPGTIGKAISRSSRFIWFICSMAATFLFLHTLLNPNGDLAKALASTNIHFFLGTIAAFVVFTFVVWLFFKVVNGLTGKRKPTTPDSTGARILKFGCVVLILIMLCCLCQVLSVLVIDWLQTSGYF